MKCDGNWNRRWDWDHAYLERKKADSILSVRQSVQEPCSRQLSLRWNLSNVFWDCPVSRLFIIPRRSWMGVNFRLFLTKNIIPPPGLWVLSILYVWKLERSNFLWFLWLVSTPTNTSNTSKRFCSSSLQLQIPLQFQYSNFSPILDQTWRQFKLIEKVIRSGLIDWSKRPLMTWRSPSLNPAMRKTVSIVLIFCPFAISSFLIIREVLFLIDLFVKLG